MHDIPLLCQMQHRTILVAFTEKLYEPLLCQVDAITDVYKTLFLLGVSSACCISELRARSVEPRFLIGNPQPFNLAVNPSFLLKINI